MENSLIYVFTGTSGSGRKTIARQAGAESGWSHVLSCTTRPPRDREIPDGDYHYLSDEQFATLLDEGAFAQWVRIDGYSYGILSKDLLQALAEERKIYLILNKDGAADIKKQYGNRVVQIFLYVDKQTVRERLESKGVSHDVIDHYMDHYMEEVIYRKSCDIVIENVEIKRTQEELRQKLAKLV